MATDYPLKECSLAAALIISDGGDVYQKFTCGKCGARNTMSDKNVFYKTGQCEDCGHITNIEEAGCNYLVHYHG